jgi:hypothetical protein
MKAARLVRGVGIECMNRNLKAGDLPNGLNGIFQSLEKYVIHS